jgi:hypothetical protein
MPYLSIDFQPATTVERSYRDRLVLRGEDVSTIQKIAARVIALGNVTEAFTDTEVALLEQIAGMRTEAVLEREATEATMIAVTQPDPPATEPTEEVPF